MTDPIWVDDQQREWFPDPAGRADYRGKRLGVWTDVVADKAWTMTTDPVGGAALRGETSSSQMPAAPSPSAATPVVRPLAVQAPKMSPDGVGVAIEVVGFVVVGLSVIALLFIAVAISTSRNLSFGKWVLAMAVPTGVAAAAIFQGLLLVGFGRIVRYQRESVELLDELRRR